MGGMATAFEELTLVVFTTLAPTGVCACIIASLVAMWGVSSASERVRLQHMCAIPLFLSMVGLVMSSTHLGTPANALYVVDGIGRSPLSNEVAACVLFMGSSGVFWLHSFALSPNEGLQKAWAAANALLGVICIANIALAYNAPTILTWNTPFAVLSVWLEALAGGPLLALLVFRSATARPSSKTEKGLILAGFAGFLSSLAVLIAQYVHLHTLESGIMAAADLVPGYPAVLLAYAGAGLFAYWCATRRVAPDSFSRGMSLDHEAPAENGSKLGWAVAASLAFMAALFVVRFCFYMMHLTYGIGF